MSDAFLQAEAFVEAWGPQKSDPRRAEFIGDVADLLSSVGRAFIVEILNK